MGMTNPEILELLERTGHLSHPFGRPNPFVPKSSSLDDPANKMAIASFQNFHTDTLSPLIAKHHPERTWAAVFPDGVIGDATEELMGMERICGNPDVGPGSGNNPDEIERAQGSGNWRACHGVGNFHAVSIRVDDANMPDHVRRNWDEIKKRVSEAYGEVGLKIHWDGRAPVNIDFSFVSNSDGWIGLAIVANGVSCNEKIWCRYLSKYTGGSSDASIIQQWVTLVCHEIGHNCGLGHNGSGGKMNAFIVNGLPTSWKNDPSYSQLRSRFGGEPIPTDEPDPPTPPGPPPAIPYLVFKGADQHGRKVQVTVQEDPFA